MEYRHLPNTSGIYKIVNTSTGATYIGSSIHIRERVRDHRSMLIRGTHHSIYMQNSWNKRSPSEFVASCITECPDEELTEKEAYFIQTTQPHYNMNRFALRGGSSIRTDSFREELAVRAKKQWEDPEYRSKQSTSRETLMNDPDYRAMRSRVSKQREDNNPELAANRGQLLKEKFEDEDFRRIHTERVNKSYTEDPSIKVRISQKVKSLWSDPEYRKMMKCIPDDVVIEILTLLRQRITHKQIAEQFGYSIANIDQISANKTYKHINRETLEVDWSLVE